MSLIHNLYKKYAGKVDLPFLIFMLTISSNKVYLKVIALILIFALRPKFNFIFSKKIPLFYPLIILLATLQFLIFGHDFSLTHTLVFLVGVFYWFMCYAYMYQTYLFVNQNKTAIITNTLTTFLYFNFGLCIINYFQVCYKAETLLPFLQTEGGYGASAGDYIVGLFGAPSYINAIMCSLLALHFLHIKKTKFFFLAAFCSLLSFANIINLIFLGIQLLYVVFVNDNKKRAFIVLSVIMCLVMYIYISPSNYIYMKKTIGLSVGNEMEIMPEVVLAKPGEVSDAKPAQQVKYVNDSSAAKQKILMFDRSHLFNNDFDEYKTYYPVDIKSSPGKKVAVLQTLNFMKDNPVSAVFGAGIGNFSSRPAFQFSGRDSSRLFQKLPRYCSGFYFKNNLLIYDSMKQLPSEYHSIKHFPNNFFSQLLGEYGIIGLVIFLIYYLYFFYKRSTNKLFFFTLLICVSCYLMLDYLYEFFNVMILFEMLLFINCKGENELVSDDE